MLIMHIMILMTLVNNDFLVTVNKNMSIGFIIFINFLIMDTGLENVLEMLTCYYVLYSSHLPISKILTSL